MTQQAAPAEVSAVAKVIDQWSQAICSKNAAGVVAQLTDDVLQYTLAPPLGYRGKEAEDLQAWFDTWEGPLSGDASETDIVVGGDVAFATALVRMRGTKTDGQKADVWFRQTIGLTRHQGVWKIAHVHSSVPFYMDGSFRAAIDLKP